MKAEELYQEFLKLTDLEKIKFQKILNLYQSSEKILESDIKNQIFNKMSQVKNVDGTPYFDKEYLKNNLGL